jgi:hypothetical protein
MIFIVPLLIIGVNYAYVLVTVIKSNIRWAEPVARMRNKNVKLIQITESREPWNT